MTIAGELMAAQPRSGSELRAELGQRFPDHDAASMAYACRNKLAVVQVPPRGLWSRSGQVRTTTLEHWLGRPVDARPSIDELAVRYFAVFGPASVADLTAWCRLAGMNEVVERLRPRLRSYRLDTATRGRELFDIRDATLADADRPAPVRILPEYDNALLSFADRARFTDPRPRTNVDASPGLAVHGTFLIDGLVRATWNIARDRATGTVTMTVTPSHTLSKRIADSVRVRAQQYLDFAEPAATREVRITGAR